jgi:hypothetical protein
MAFLIATILPRIHVSRRKSLAQSPVGWQSQRHRLDAFVQMSFQFDSHPVATAD